VERKWEPDPLLVMVDGVEEWTDTLHKPTKKYIMH
jgi:hypothetical protein